MRTATIDGKELRLTEKQHKQLLRRFDVSAANPSDRLGGGGYRSIYMISRKCICPKHSIDSCYPCPFSIWESKSPGCINILNILELSRNYLSFGFSIYWLSEHDTEARAKINAIREALLSMKKE